MKSRKKTITAVLVFLIMLFLFAGTAYAYDRVPRIALGWSCYRTSHSLNAKVASELLGGCDNRSGIKNVPYTFSQTITRSWSKGGSLSASISGSSSGLGAAISSTIEWKFDTSYSQYQKLGPVTVKAGERLRIYGDFTGNKTGGLARYFVAWVCTKQGDYRVNSVHGCMLRTVWG